MVERVDCALDLECKVLCKNPYIFNKGAFGCGQCLPCRINRRRDWASRIVLESLVHEQSSFITLTYRDEELKVLENGLATLVPEDLQKWLKRLRKAIAPGRVRYFAAGEYGGKADRPHFHLALFGYPNCRFMRSRYTMDLRGNYLVGRCCPACDLVMDTWGKGKVQLDVLCMETANYIAGYTVKKMTGESDVRLEGRCPEFARMSSVPGIGHDALFDIASVWLQHGDSEDVDVPGQVRMGLKQLPLGRYLRKKLRVLCGRDESAPEGVLNESQAALSPVFDLAAALAKEAPAGSRKALEKSWVKHLLGEVNAGAHARLDWLETVNKRRGK